MTTIRRLGHAARALIRRTALAPALRRALRAPLPAVGTDAWHASLRGAINTQIAVELELTTLRRRLALGELAFAGDPGLERVVGTLLQQCINNEWVWRAGAEEYAAVRAGIEAARDGSDWPAFVLAALYDRIERVVSRLGDPTRFIGAMPVDLRGIVGAYVSAWEERRALQDAIPSFGSAAGEVHDVVTEMYEHYPYPRWLSWGIPPVGSRRARVAAYAPSQRVADPTTPIEVLVAGCGTGSKAVAYAFGYGANSQILGIDLSRPSLAYAEMMARRYGARGLGFLRMNLLELPSLGRSFDIVECTGVLHHLPDPSAGARAIAAVTRPGGVVHLSLYSERARSEIVVLRRGHEHRIGEVSDDEVREFRWRLMQDDPASVDQRLCLRWDFFDLARCRDLLFHPLEHRYSIPQAVRLIEGAGLEFRGIELPVLHENRVWMRLPPRRDRLDPAVWDEFEARYPEAFGELFELWAVKRA